MKVETGGLIYDDDDKRCTVSIKRSLDCATNQANYLVLVSCYDGSTGGVNWYFGTTPIHFYEYTDDIKKTVIERIMQNGGKVWNLLDDLKASGDYIESLFE